MADNQRPRSPEDYMVSEFTPDFQLEPETTALMIIDLQNCAASRTSGLGKWMSERGREADVAYRFDHMENVVVPNVQRILAFFRQYKLRVIHITFGTYTSDVSELPLCIRPIASVMNSVIGNEEHQILDELKPIEGELVINKRSFSPFNSTGIDNILRSMGIQYLVITGTSTNMCVETTARDAADRGYSVVLVDDCCNADNPEYHAATLVSFSRMFGQVQTMERVINSLSSVLKK
jgi:nicotinamidase-related amidase